MATSGNPLILSCGGSTDTAKAADAMAAELAAAGLGTRGHGPRPDRALIAVDGCAGACCSRRVESLGLRPVVTLDASALRDSAAAIAAARSQLERHRPRRHRSRPQPPLTAAPSSRPHTVRDYLLALDALTAPVVDCGTIAPGLPALAAHVSRLLGVSRPTAGEMLGRLEAAGWIARTAGRQVALTDDGRAAADDAVRRHRLLECFAVEYLGYELPDAFDRARRLDDSFDGDAIRRLASALGEPERCPHGRPLDAADARAVAPQLRVLTTLAAGEAANVVWIEERAPGLLRELLAHRILPGARVGAADRVRLSAAARAAVLVQAAA